LLILSPDKRNYCFLSYPFTFSGGGGLDLGFDKAGYTLMARTNFNANKKKRMPIPPIECWHKKMIRRYTTIMALGSLNGIISIDNESISEKT